MDCRKGRLEPASERLVYNRKIHGCGISRTSTPIDEEIDMQKTKEQKIIDALLKELEFVSKNPDARAAKSVSQYADHLLFAIKIHMGAA